MDDQSLHPPVPGPESPNTIPDPHWPEPAAPTPPPAPDAPPAADEMSRLEEQLQALQRTQRRLLWAMVALAVAVALALAAAFAVGSRVYRELESAWQQVETISGTLEESLGKLDTQALDDLMQTLPDIADRLSKIDVDTLNSTLDALPELMESVERMEDQVNQIASLFNGLGRLFG